MVEPLNTVVDRQEDAATYKPLALLAVAAFAVAVLFTVIIVVLTLVGLVTGRPVLEPWLIALAVGGVLLSIAARWQIMLSEGTREGRRLTVIAWWLSVVGGCIYGAYYAGNLYAIQKQAVEFVEVSFLQPLTQNKLEEAFFFTHDPDMRQGMGFQEAIRRFGVESLETFRREQLVRLMDRSGDQTVVESLGIAEWRQGPEGLEVVTLFRLSTPEGEYQVIVPILGRESRQTGLREWFVKRASVGLRPINQSAYGEALSRLQNEADNYLFSWIHEKRENLRRAEMYLETLPITREDRQARYRQFLVSNVLAPALVEGAALSHMPVPPLVSIAALVEGRTVVALRFPEIDKLPNKLVQWDETKQKQPDDVKAQMLPVILDPGNMNLAMSAAASIGARTVMTANDQEVSAWFPVEFMLPVKRYLAQGRVYAMCEGEEFLKALRQLQSDRQPNSEAVRELFAKHPHHWRIAKVVVDLAQVQTETPRPGAVGNPGPALAPPRLMPGAK